MFTASPLGLVAERRGGLGLCGIVTFAPAKPSAGEAADRVSASASGSTVERARTPSRARAAAKAAFCIRGESESRDGLAEQPDQRVAHQP